MNRRDFLRTSAIALGTAATTPSVLGKEASPLTAGRQVYPLRTRWRYSAQLLPAAADPSFDDTALQQVILPHTNISLPWHSFDDKSYEFISTYRRVIDMPAGTTGKRVFLDFEGAMTASTVWFNGARIGTYRGGYTPFSFEVTDQVKPGKNILAVDVDSTERKDIPPFGFEIDYLTFGGIYRDVWLRIVPEVFIENIHAITQDVLTSEPRVSVEVYLERPAGTMHKGLSLRAQLRDGENVIATGTIAAHSPAPAMHHWEDSDQAAGALPYDSAKDAPSAVIALDKFQHPIQLWDLKTPQLYIVAVQLLEGDRVIDEQSCRIGFREATFTEHGFSLNGKIVKLHGLDRHQTFPWVGQAMGERAQRQDAKILRRDLNCNIVRTSHYPQSRHFLDACDEMGLLVLEEIPGWQHIGDKGWQDVAVDNTRRMVRRDWNRPSIVLWGVRINESEDNHDFYSRTNAIAHALDRTRQTCGVRNSESYNSEFLEDVFTFNDFGWPIRKPNHPRFLNTEFVGHTFPTKITDGYERQREHVIRHARMHDALASDPQYSGGLGWCAFDYNTHANFGAGDRICYHGVMDIFRMPKPAAGFYKSYVPPSEEIVLEPAFTWADNDESVSITYALICSNVDHIKMYTLGGGTEHLAGEGGPDRAQFPHLPYPPFHIDFVHDALDFPNWGDLRIDGYIDGKKVVTKTLAGDGADAKLSMYPDDTKLFADGGDAVRVVVAVEDKYGNARHPASEAISFTLTGPADLIGDNPISLLGGRCAVWVRTRHEAGEIVLTAKHARLGSVSARFSASPVDAEIV
ncbi:glycoside hydrolase family 2 protein [Silvibacterium acidisoli]|uniref:glycoside hydrolase family 2 protein n=1 Tax=Acidobacteriaceae bacterium ZG23-2 TaxID=2883246 RepID=UPI00406CF53F